MQGITRPPQTSTKRAAIYCRVATMAQDDPDRLARRVATCQQYATRHGYTVAAEHTFAEVANGLALRDRPHLSALRQAVRARAIETVIIEDLHELTRDPALNQRLVDECSRYGVGITVLAVAARHRTTAIVNTAGAA